MAHFNNNFLTELHLTESVSADRIYIQTHALAVLKICMQCVNNVEKKDNFIIGSDLLPIYTESIKTNRQQIRK